MSSDNKALVPYTERGLTEEEAKIVLNYEQRGRPGLSKDKSDKIRDLYLAGLSCRQIADLLPSFGLDLILYARWKDRWDEELKRRMEEMARNLPAAIAQIKAEAISTMLMALKASNIKIQKELADYIAAPDREKAPATLAQSWHQFFSLIETVKELVEPKPAPGSKFSDGAPAATPLVSVTVNQGSEKPVIEVKQSDAKSALLAKVKKPQNESK